MPIIKSAKKRVRTARKATAKNLKSKRALKAAMKDVRVATSGTSKKSVSDAHRSAQSELDKAVKKNLMHKRKVARKQRQLAAHIKANSTRPTTAKKTTKKTVAKK